MKKITVFILFLIVSGLFAQEAPGAGQKTAPMASHTESPSASEPSKFALVIGNSNYSGGLSKLGNPVNDANDIAYVLERLGFTVDKILNGNLEQMENSVERLREKLAAELNAYGFFFYAGHGVQSGGENFLIPVNANIPNENYLKTRSLSVQVLLDDLNDARNSLNVVVLDACRDNPFGWNRSGSRGLSIVSRQPADSIIVYATSAGQRASDGDGRNGLFTSQLLKNLATPGLEVKEVFNRTGADVAEVSGKEQMPAIYNQFFGTAYLGVKPDSSGNVIVQPVPWPPEGWGRSPGSANAATRLNSLGASVGSAFATPKFFGTLRGTVALYNYVFAEPGMDLGLGSTFENAGYYSLTPYVHFAYFRPFAQKFGGYAGLGASCMISQYTFEEGMGYPVGKEVATIFAADLSAGVTILDMIDVSWTLRTTFKNAVNKFSVGYFWRFK